MWKMKWFLLSLLMAFTLSAAAATAAAAEETRGVMETREAIEGKSENFKIQTELVGTSVAIVCSESVSPSAKNAILEEAVLEGTTEAKKCKVENSKEENLVNCKIKEPLEAKFTGEMPAEGEYLLKGIGKEELFAESKIEGESCGLKGTYQVKGSQICTVSEVGVEEAAHDFVCTATGSKLKVGSAAAKFTDTEIVKLKSDASWDMTKTSNISVDNTSVKHLGVEEFSATRTFKNKNLWWAWRPSTRKVTGVSNSTSVWSFTDRCQGARIQPEHECTVEVKFKSNLEAGLFESILEMEDSTSSAFVTMEGEF